MRRTLRTILSTTVLSGTGVVVMASLAVAAIPAADGTIKGCYDASGIVRVIQDTSTWPSGTTSLNWNQRGPQGPQGIPGRGVHWFHLSSDGRLLGSSETSGWSGTWGTGRYYVGVTGLDMTRCAVSITSVTPYNGAMYVPAVSYVYSAYVMYGVKQITANSWPLAYADVATETYLNVAC
jgi:hypothetical protein